MNVEVWGNYISYFNNGTNSIGIRTHVSQVSINLILFILFFSKKEKNIYI